jgi:hypothetical protein
MTPQDVWLIIALGAFLLAACGIAEAHPRIHAWANRTCDRIAGIDR